MACCFANFSHYDSVSNRALKQAWLASFKEAHNRALDVEMKKVFLFHGKLGNPWSSLFTNSLNIIDCCSLEVNDVNVVANDVLVNCVTHKSCSKDDETFVNKVDVLVRTSILDIEQQDAVEGCILESFNFVEIPKATKLFLIIDVPRKGSVFKMRLITELNAYPPSKLPLDRLRQVQYRTCVKSSFTQEVHAVEEAGLFYDVGIIMKKGKKLIWYLGHVQKIIKHFDKGRHINYVKHVQLNEEGIKILPKYYKQIEGLHYSYGGHETDFVNFKPCYMLDCFDKRCRNRRVFVGTRVQESFGQLCEE